MDGISFTVRRGTITGLLGRNGAGKTTTIRMITGIFMPDSGSIDWLAETGQGVPFRDRIGYLPEERGLYKTMKVTEHLIFLAEIKGRRPADMKPHIERWLERFELTDKRDAKVEELSKGNQQKVQLIGTLLHDPELIILDEPQSGLDPVNMVLVRKVLNDLRDEGKTILLSTHMMAEAEKMADEIILIHRGQVVLDGTLTQVRETFGKNTLHIDYDGDGAFLQTLPQVRKATMQGHSAELALNEGADAQEILQATVGRLRIRRFEIASPSLEEIFIEKVGRETLTQEEEATR
ncbi:MAG TPA: ATP-binding cassette domain-containing protein [Thermoanaerobaculia bacterium]